MILGLLATCDPVARRLVATVTDEHLVQRKQPLAGIQSCLDHRPLLGRCRPRNAGGQQRGQAGKRHPDQYPIVQIGSGVEAKHGLSVEIFRDVGHESVLPDGNDHVLRSEQEPVEVRPRHACLAPVVGDA